MRISEEIIACKILALFLILLLVLFSPRIYCEPGLGKIRGTVLDSTDSKAIEYATILLCDKITRKSASGVISGNNGSFSFDKVPKGNYYIAISFMGYKKKTIDSVMISDVSREIDMGNILLSPSDIRIQSVDVTGERKLVEHKTDKFIYNVDIANIAAGSSAADIIKKAPFVNVDNEGNIQIRGNQASVLVDGKISSLGNEAAEQIPGTAVDKIEVITNPSAKYDADGGALINIILKKQSKALFNAMLQGTTGTKDNYSTSINTNYKPGEIGYSLNYDFRRRDRKTNGSSKTSYFYPGYSSMTDQRRTNSSGRNSHNIRIGANAKISEENSLAAYVSYNNLSMKRNTRVFTENQNESNNSNYSTFIRANNTGESLEYILNYKREFEKEGEQLNGDLYYSRSYNNKDNQRDILTNNSNGGSAGRNLELINNSTEFISLSSDFVYPLGEVSKFEAGIKGIYRNRNSNFSALNYSHQFQKWNSDENLCNNFNYEEKIFSSYVLFSSVYYLDFQLGARIEYSDNIVRQMLDKNKVNNEYFSFIPTVHISRRISETGTLRFSFSKRLNRPLMELLNPFIVYSDPQNASSGNPMLKPESINSFEVGYDFDHSLISLYTTCFYRNARDNVNMPQHYVAPNIIMEYPENNAEYKNYGFELSGVCNMSWLELNSNFSLYRSEYKEKNYYGYFQSSAGNVWYAQLQSSFRLPWNVTMQISYSYNSRMVTPAMSFGDISYTDINIKKQLFNKSLVLNLQVSNVFNSNASRTSIFNKYFESRNYYFPNDRVISLSMTYTFNKYRKSPSRKPEEDNGAIEF